jgi:SAM-dependent methyltransferase
VTPLEFVVTKREGARGILMSGRLGQGNPIEEQYRDASNLNARIALHVRFSTGQYGLHRWVFDRFDLPQQSRILELGCGTGRLWLQNLDRIPQEWDITMSDSSPGMPQEAHRNLQRAGRSFRFMVADAQAIPLADHSLEAVIANHTLYHVPDIALAIS